MKPADYISKFAPLSIRTTFFSTLLPSVQIAQSILESGWGESVAAKKDFAFFGVKSHGKAGGRKHKTQEWRDGRYVDIEDNFRTYRSAGESFRDHLKFLKENNRYDIVFAANGYKAQAKALKKAGYATSPTYAEKLISIIEQYDLQRFDKQKTVLQIATAIFVFILIFLIIRK